MVHWCRARERDLVEDAVCFLSNLFTPAFLSVVGKEHWLTISGEIGAYQGRFCPLLLRDCLGRKGSFMALPLRQSLRKHVHDERGASPP